MCRAAFVDLMVSTAADGEPSAAVCSPGSLLLLLVLPSCNICGFLWAYTALPLHFLDSGWSMLQLSLLLTLVYVPRVVMTTLTGRVGDWLCVPVAGVAAVLNVYLANYPHSLTACWVALSATCASVNPPAFRSFVHARFSRQGTWQMQRALRIFTLADTLGYACAPFIGGVLYDNGGLRACATFAACTCSACALLPLVLRECRESLASARLSCSSVPSTLSSAGGVPPADVPPNSIHPPNGVTLAYLGPPVTAVMCAAFANICVYAVEWCLYALYFRLKYGWSGA